MIVKLPELSDYLDLSERQIDKLAKAGILSRVKRGQFDLKGSIRGYLEYIRKGDPNKKTSLVEQEIEFKRAQTHKLQLEIEKLEGTLIPDSVFQKYMARLITQVRTLLLLIENETINIRNAASNEDARGLLRASIHTVLDALSQAEEIVPSDEEDNEGGAEAVQASPETEDERVGRRKHVAVKRRLKRGRKVSH